MIEYVIITDTRLHAYLIEASIPDLAVHYTATDTLEGAKAYAESWLGRTVTDWIEGIDKTDRQTWTTTVATKTGGKAA